MSVLRRLQNPKGLWAKFGYSAIDMAMYAHLGHTLKERGKDNKATLELLSGCERLKIIAGARSGSSWLGDERREGLAKNWFETHWPGKDFKSLSLAEQKLLAGRFDAWCGYAHNKGQGKFVAGRSIDLTPEETAYITVQSILFNAPIGFTDDPQKAEFLTDEKVGEARELAKIIGDLSPLFEAALKEWKKEKLVAPRANPFAKADGYFKAGSWVESEPVEGLLCGTLWVAACDRKEGLFFLGPNGSDMREITRAKIFSTSGEAKAWGEKQGATAVMELAWRPLSFEPTRAPGFEDNKRLVNLFCEKEAEELGAVVKAVKEPLAPKRGRSL